MVTLSRPFLKGGIKSFSNHRCSNTTYECRHPYIQTLICFLSVCPVRETQDGSMYSDEHLPADPINLACFVGMVSGRGTQSNWSYLKGFILQWHPEKMNICMALAISVYPISDLISLFFTSLSPSAALVKRHAPIKCLPFQLFSSHVILPLDYNPRLPPLSHHPHPSPALHAGSQRLYSSRTGSIASNVFCHLSYATAWLTWLRLIKSPLASAGHCSERVPLCNSLSLSELSTKTTQPTAACG